MNAAALRSYLSSEGKLGPGSLIPFPQLAERTGPENVPTGVAEIDALTGGLPRGSLTEICGPASSGRTSLLLSVMAVAAARGEVCALVDTCDAFDPESAIAAGMDLQKLLWVRCGKAERGCAPFAHRRESARLNPSLGMKQKPLAQDDPLRRVEQALRAADLLLSAGGFGLVVLDLGDVPHRIARRVPLTTWFRFRRAVEHTPAVLVVLEQEPCAGSCSSLVLRLEPAGARCVPQADKPAPPHARLLDGLEIAAQVVRSRVPPARPARPAATRFCAQAKWRIA
ncbi:MAG TPA: hypothetical protein VNK82_02625 [Terriglobales bacterium]|nr:hypothetical protein [Terriglobales bacterium]